MGSILFETTGKKFPRGPGSSEFQNAFVYKGFTVIAIHNGGTALSSKYEYAILGAPNGNRAFVYGGYASRLAAQRGIDAMLKAQTLDGTTRYIDGRAYKLELVEGSRL